MGLNVAKHMIEHAILNEKFLSHADTPSSYSGKADYLPYVNAAENALEFQPLTTFITTVDTDTWFLHHMNGAGFNADYARGDDTATNNNVTIDTVNKKFGGGSFLSNATSDYIQFSSTANLNQTEGTIDFWIRPAYSGAPASNRYILYIGNTQNGLEVNHHSNGRLYFYWTGNSSKSGTSIVWSPTANQWYHIAITYNGTDGKLYLDGNLEITIPSFTAWAVLPLTIELFNYRFTHTVGYDGNMDEFRISKIVRWTANFTPSAQPYGSKFTGSMFIDGYLQVTKDVTFDAGLSVAGTSTLATVDINAGAIDNATVGSTTPAAGEFSTLGVNTNYDFPTVDGTDGQTLTTDGAGSVSFKSGVNGHTRVKVHLNVDHSNIPDVTKTLLEFDVEAYDTLGEFDTGTHKFTCTKAGYYIFSLRLLITALDDGKYGICYIDKNDVDMCRGVAFSAIAGGLSNPSITTTEYLEVGDEITAYVYHNNGDAVPDVKKSHYYTTLEINFLGES